MQPARARRLCRGPPPTLATRPMPSSPGPAAMTDSMDPDPRRRALALGLAAIVVAAAVAFPAGAPAQDLQSQLSQKRSALRHARDNEVALSTTISPYSSR